MEVDEHGLWIRIIGKRNEALFAESLGDISGSTEGRDSIFGKGVIDMIFRLGFTFGLDIARVWDASWSCGG